MDNDVDLLLISRSNLMNTEKLLSDYLNVSKSHIYLCERYGCNGLWNNSNYDYPHSNKIDNNVFLFDAFKEKLNTKDNEI